MRFPVEIVRRVRERVGDDFIVMYRMSLLDLVDDAQSWEEIVELAQKLEAEGVSIINTGIGWHEARIPTIVTSVPRAAFSWVTGKLRPELNVPVVASNRINTPEIAEQIIADGEADLVSMARPLLSDPYFVQKAAEGRADEINTCIACNQACLDHTFVNKRASCMVNPRAGHETELVLLAHAGRQAHRRRGRRPGRPGRRRRAGRSRPPRRAVRVAARGRRPVPPRDADPRQGGVRRDAALLRPHARQRRRQDPPRAVGPRPRTSQDFDEVVLATGVEPRIPSIPGVDHPTVVSYQDVIRHEAPVGQRVAILGAGGIGFDVAEFLLHDSNESLEHWMERWGVVDPAEARGGLATKAKAPPRRDVTLLQRKTTELGKGLGKTSGWVHRATLKDSGVEMVKGVSYDRIDDDGLHITVATGKDTSRVPRGRRSTRSCCAPVRSRCAT